MDQKLNKKIFVQTWGCQMNDRDSENIVGLLSRHNYTQTAEPEDADFILLNTCSIREHASHKAVSQLGRFSKIKRKRQGGGPIIGVAGCLAQQEGTSFLKRFPYIDLLIGPDAIQKLPVMLERLEAGGQPQSDFTRDLDEPVFLHEYLSYPVSKPELREARPKHSAFVTISKGCDFRCTFCVVPTTRGPERSAPPLEILDEVKQLAERGIREITLLGQNVNSYGKNFSPAFEFHHLLRLIEKEIPRDSALQRIRFMTSHPIDASEDLMRCFAELPRLCKFLHLPVQCGDDKVLRRMKRLYTIADYRDRLARLRSYVPDIALSTDIIVGFPGETEEQFQRTLDLLQEVRYNSLYAFKYSSRPNTPAQHLEDDVSETEKDERLERVLECQRSISWEENRRLEGQSLEVLVEGPNPLSGKSGFTGRTELNRLVHLDTPPDADLVGRLVTVVIDSAHPHCLMGRYVAGSER